MRNCNGRETATAKIKKRREIATEGRETATEGREIATGTFCKAL